MTGQTLSHYRILEKVGQGGMGVVYKALDTHLDRLVALKVLSPDQIADPEQIRRFIQEAQAIATLNHANIAHVYDFDEERGVRWLAMEFVEGQSLDDRGPLSAEQVIDIGIQIADALAEAHNRGVVHRDVKPGNIMLTPRGQVKMLDFGLAKVVRRDTAGNPAAKPLTRPGQVAGTLRYMSPEQCMGREVDGRSDIFSAGTVLYNLATGREAFQGTSRAAVHDGILNRTPEPITQFNPALPRELSRIIAKAMEKKPDRRYQTGAEFSADLKRLQRNSDPSVPVTVPARRRMIWLAAGIIVGSIAAWALWSLRGGSPVPAAFHTVPLTSLPGSESQPSFSPDASQVAFSWNSETEENWEIYVKTVGAGSPLRLTNHPGADTSPAWSPEGDQIAFLRQADADAGFFVVPARGGKERKIADASPNRVGVNSPYVAWEPDSKRLVVSDRTAEDEAASLFVVSLEKGDRYRLTMPPPNTFGDGSPAFSPDGKTIAFVRTTSLSIQDIYSVPLKGGEPTRLTFDNRRVMGMTWDRASGNILFTSARGGTERLWRMSPSGGELKVVPGIGEGASLLAVSREGRRLAYTRWTNDTNIWRYPLERARNNRTDPVRLISSTRAEQGPQYSPDGKRIVFASSRSGTAEIWISDRDGQNANQLTTIGGPATGTPHWSPDSRQIAYDSRPGGNPDIYIIGLDGGTPRRFTSDASQETVPSWSRDGRWIYFGSNRTGVYQIWKAPVDGGPAVQVTKGGGFHGHESMDRRYLYYAKSPNQQGLWKVPIDGGEETPVLEALRGGFWGYWEITAAGLYYVERRESEREGVQYVLILRDLASNHDRQILTFEKRPFNSGLAISPDGLWSLYTQADQSDTDIMFVDNFTDQ